MHISELNELNIYNPNSEFREFGEFRYPSPTFNLTLNNHKKDVNNPKPIPLCNLVNQVTMNS